MLDDRSRGALRAVEHHRFASRGRWLLFDVEALTVAPSEPVDAALLARAAMGATVAELVAAALAAGHDREHAVARIDELVEQRFLLADGDAPERAEPREPSRHITFMVNVAQRCNLTCTYCYVNEGHFDYPEPPIPRMRAETADGLVDRLHALFPGFSTYAYHFYGGEPLLNFEAIRRVVAQAEARAAQAGTRTDYYITTNGTLCDREVADFFDQHRFTVYYSIDGDVETHDEERRYAGGRGSYADVEANLAYLRTRPAVHLIGSSVVRKGVTLEAAMQKLAGHGARQCKAERVRLFDDQALALTGAEHDGYLADIEGLIDHYVTALEARTKPMDFRLSSKILQVLTRSRRDFFCPAGERMFGVSADGELYPCALHVGRPGSRLGHVATGVDAELRAGFRTRFGADGQAGCRTCWTRRLCGGGCSAMVDRFGHEDCEALRGESEAAIAIYQHFAETDPSYLYGLVSPKVVEWVQGLLDDPGALAPTEPHAERVGHDDELVTAAPPVARHDGVVRLRILP
ncbi:MAG TPA: radical SAM protein [Kofleriaceae bacterium]|nr:radical SAM protein [Kofleriaceae bacterium]